MATLIMLGISVVMQAQVESARLDEQTERPAIIPAKQLRSEDKGYTVRVFRRVAAKDTEIIPYVKDDQLAQLRETMEKLGIDGRLTEVNSHTEGPAPRELLIVIVENPTEDKVTFALPTRGPLYCIQRKGEWFLYPRGYARSGYCTACFWKSEDKLVLELKNSEKRSTTTSTISWDENTVRTAEPSESPKKSMDSVGSR